MHTGDETLFPDLRLPRNVNAVMNFWSGRRRLCKEHKFSRPEAEVEVLMDELKNWTEAVAV